MGDSCLLSLSKPLSLLRWVPAFAGMSGKGRFAGRVAAYRVAIYPLTIPNSAHPREGGDPDGRGARLAFCTYILANRRNGALYTGHTDDLGQRVWLHKEKALGGHTAKYGIARLVWYRVHETREAAFADERRIKNWNRAWKLRMIEAVNPE